MAATVRKAKGRSGTSRFAGIPHDVMESESYTLLDGWSVKLLLELVKQYNGYNNGDLSATWKVMQGRGFNSNGTLSDALRQLEQTGMIEKTRQGGRNRCSLYALTWAPIHECKGKLEVRSTTTPSSKWKQSMESDGGKAKRLTRFAGIPHNVMESESYIQLDGWAVKLLLELAKQCSGYNNGDLSATWKVMQGRGFRSSGTLSDALRQLEQAGMIEKTRYGGRHQCSLYALTWKPIDECKGKLEVRSTTTPSNKWKQSMAGDGVKGVERGRENQKP